MTMTYKEQLLHPNWQRKRLEVFDANGFQCAVCGSKEKTLHVHHKHYVNGRQAWDYEVSELEPLCEDCHKDAHNDKERIDRVIGQFSTEMWGTLADLLVGYGEEYVDVDEWEFVDEQHARAGQIAWFLDSEDESADRSMAELLARILKAVEPPVVMSMVVTGLIGGFAAARGLIDDNLVTETRERTGTAFVLGFFAGTLGINRCADAVRGAVFEVPNTLRDELLSELAPKVGADA